jgi:adenylate cyclase
VASCSSCGADNRPGRKFCSRCGAPLARTCTACGASNDPGDAFCGECGSALADEAIAPVAAPAAERRLVSVLFADLVGFTALGESVTVEELGSVAGRLNRLAADALEPPVRIVKLIGDAVMLVSPEPEPIVDVTLRLVETAAADEAFPPLRAGIACGQAVHRWGDWFGTPVNLASRLTTRARPSTVLVAEDVREAVDGRFEFSDAGRKKLKGFSAPVRAYRVKRSAG